jgi:putative hydroxymethylpyrimidine transport system substrate-binding protein
MPRGIALAALAALVLSVPAALGGAQNVTLTLDWTPNPDHVGLYYARDRGLFTHAGLDVAIHAPSDPATPLKLVGVGRSDLAVSYEQELFFAAAKKLPVIAVAAVVPQPLNSFMAIDPDVKSLRDLKGRSVGITGVPSDYATLDTALRSAGLTRKSVKVVNVGYNLLPALLAHRVDAVLGVYRNVEGIQLQLRGLRPTIIPVNRAGVPTYDELVLVASKTRLGSDSRYRSTVRRFVRAFVNGTLDARAHPGRALAILRKVTASDEKFLARATPATLRLLAGRKGVGCLDVRAWQRFGSWMRARGLLKKPIRAASVVTTRYLPSRCRSAGRRARRHSGG